MFTEKIWSYWTWTYLLLPAAFVSTPDPTLDCLNCQEYFLPHLIILKWIVMSFLLFPSHWTDPEPLFRNSITSGWKLRNFEMFWWEFISCCQKNFQVNNSSVGKYFNVYENQWPMQIRFPRGSQPRCGWQCYCFDSSRDGERGVPSIWEIFTFFQVLMSFLNFVVDQQVYPL